MYIDFTLAIFLLLVTSLIAWVGFFAFSPNLALAVTQTAMSVMGYCPVLLVVLQDLELQFSHQVIPSVGMAGAGGG